MLTCLLQLQESFFSFCTRVILMLKFIFSPQFCFLLRVYSKQLLWETYLLGRMTKYKAVLLPARSAASLGCYSRFLNSFLVGLIPQPFFKKAFGIMAQNLRSIVRALLPMSWWSKEYHRLRCQPAVLQGRELFIVPGTSHSSLIITPIYE